MRRTALVAVTALALALVWAPAASAEETDCTGAIGATTEDNIRVPDGATCTLDGTTAQGSVVVGTGATLDATGVNVIGNIQAEDASAVTIDGASRVGGSVQLNQGGRHAVALGGTTAVCDQILADAAAA